MHDPETLSREMSELAVQWMRAQPAVNAFIHSSVFDPQDAEELVQDVAAAVVQQYAKYDPDRPFTPWVIGIARKKVLDYLRRHKKDRHVFDSDTLSLLAQAHVEEAGRYDDRKAALRACIKGLKGRSRQVIEMRYQREMPTQTIADRLGITANALFILLHRTRLALAKCIEDRLAAEEVTR